MGISGNRKHFLVVKESAVIIWLLVLKGLLKEIQKKLEYVIERVYFEVF